MSEPFEIKAWLNAQATHHNEDNREIISMYWCIDDVKSVREDLTDEQAIAVLHTFEDRYDCGDDFMLLEIIADELYPLSDNE